MVKWVYFFGSYKGFELDIIEKDVKLSKVLTFEKCKPLFEDNKVVEELMQFLPSDVDKSVQEIKETIRSPQLQGNIDSNRFLSNFYKVAIRSFVHALRSRQIQPLLMQFGFNEEECMSVYNVESFLKVLKKKRYIILKLLYFLPLELVNPFFLRLYLIQGMGSNIITTDRIYGNAVFISLAVAKGYIIKTKETKQNITAIGV